jgi:DNA primase
MAAFDNNIVFRIQQATDIVDLVSEYVSLSKKGKEMVGLCPFHDDHRPSMYVNPDKQIFKCFACGAGGDVLKFVQMLENLSFPQAIERLAQRAGIKLEKNFSKARPDDVDPAAIAKVNAWAAQHFQKNLKNPERGKVARNYLQEREFLDADIKNWAIGLALDKNDLAEAARKNNITSELLIKAGLITPQLADRFENRIIFPIWDVTGRIIAFGARTLDQSGPKYINSNNTALFEKSNCLYGLNLAKHKIVASSTAIVVEGYTDCIMSHKFGFTSVVATLGTSFTAGHTRILKRYAKKIILIFDSDTAGIEAANRALEICLAGHIDIRLAFVPQQKDPCDFLLSAGKEQFQNIIENAVDVFSFKWDRLTKQLLKDNLVDGKAAVEQFLQTISTAISAGSMDPVEQGMLANKLSKVIGLSSKDINAELDKRIRKLKSPATSQTGSENASPVDLGTGASAVAQRQILEVLLNQPSLIDSLKLDITAEIFDVPVLKQIASVLLDIRRQNPNPSIQQVLSATESVDLASIITHLEQLGREKGNFQTCLLHSLSFLKNHQNKKKIEQLKKTCDETELLKCVLENSRKQNPHNIGML